VLTIVVLIVTVVAIVLAARVGVTRPELRAVAVRNLRVRPGRALLVAAGVLLATATLTSASAIGDSLRSSIRNSAYTQLGPVDEMVVASGGADTARTIADTITRAHLDGVDGVLPLVTARLTVQGRDYVPRVAQAQVIELDFAAAARFGGDPAHTGITGSTPSGNTGVMSADLATETSLLLRHSATVHAYGTARTFHIEGIAPRVGLAGLESPGAPAGSASLNLFVPPGTLAAMQGAGSQSGPAPSAVVVVSNRGGVLTSHASSTAVTAELQRALHGQTVDVIPVKQLVLDDAAAQSRQFSALFRAFGLLSLLAGLLLLLLTFGALARERAQSLGILRAFGLRRRDLAATVVLEALPSCVLGVVLGAIAGAGIAALVVLIAHGTLANAASGGVDLAFSVRTATLLTGLAIGLVASLIALAIAAGVVARTGVVTLMRGDTGTPRVIDPRLVRNGGLALGGVGLVVAIVGAVATNASFAVAGGALVAIAAPLLAPPPWRRLTAAAAAVVEIAWAVIEVRAGHRAFTGPSPAEILTIAAAMSIAAVALVSIVDRALADRRRAVGRRRTAPVTLGFAYSHATPNRTATIAAMYGVVVFTLCLVVTMAHLYAGSVDSVAAQLGGNAALEVTSNGAQPVPVKDVRELPGVTRVVGASSLDTHVLAGGSQSFADVTLVGVSPALVGHGTPPVAVGPSSASTYARVMANPDLVLVGADLRTTPQNTLDHHTPRVGEKLSLQDPTTGVTRTVTVAGLVAAARYEGVDHVYAAAPLLDTLHAAPVVQNVLYVETSPGTNNDTVAAIVDGTHLPNGAYARSFHHLADDRLSAQQRFLNLVSGYTALGLLGGAAALAVAMIDAVRERRRQLATLRALGFRRSTLRRAARVEALVIGLEGTIAGALTAALLSWRLAATGAIGESTPFSLPGGLLIAIVVIALATALAATTVAARRAARLQPAGALRASE
jgi:ABC-type antimicrobial peptide transport system permease subunit